MMLGTGKPRGATLLVGLLLGLLLLSMPVAHLPRAAAEATGASMQPVGTIDEVLDAALTSADGQSN